MKKKNINIPTVRATESTLAYYGARLVRDGDVFDFQTTQTLPVTVMEIGTRYVSDYIKHPQLGGGTFVETHNLPHLWKPLDKKSGGALLLGRKLQDGDYEFTFFKIPHGSAVHLPKNIIHTDSYLTGTWLAAYGKSEIFSTVLFKKINGDLANVSPTKK